MSERIKYRSFEPADAEVLPQLFIKAIQSVYPDLEDGAWISDLHDPENYYSDGDLVVGALGNTIVAMGGLKRVDADTAEMKRVAVDPENQGEGFGQSLLSTLEEHARQLGIKKMILDTTYNQEAARYLYEKNGYALVERKTVDHPTGETFDTFFYEKEL